MSGDDDSRVFLAVEEGKALRWSGIHECDVQRPIFRACAPISGEIFIACIKHSLHSQSTDPIYIDVPWAAGGTEASRSLLFFFLPELDLSSATLLR